MVPPCSVLLLDEIDGARGAVLRADAFPHRRCLGRHCRSLRRTDGVRQPFGRECSAALALDPSLHEDSALNQPPSPEFGTIGAGNARVRESGWK
jgi:hypothetical protein